MRVVTEIVERIRDEYREMPGLCLTGPQIERLCGGDGDLCATVLEALVSLEFLRRNDDGTYVLRDMRRVVGSNRPRRQVYPGSGGTKGTLYSTRRDAE